MPFRHHSDNSLSPIGQNWRVGGYLRMAAVCLCCEQHINILWIVFMFHIVKKTCLRLRPFLGRGNLWEAGLRTHLMSAMSTIGQSRLCSPAMSGTLRTLKPGFAPRRLPTTTNSLKILDMARYRSVLGLLKTISFPECMQHHRICNLSLN